MADFNTLIADIEAAIYENTEQAITGDALQDILLEMVTDINTAKADQGDLDDLALAVAGKADIFGTSVPLALEDNELTLKYDDFQFDLGGDDMTLTLRLSYGLISNSIGVRVYAGRGLAFGDEGVLEANPGDGLAFDASGAIVPDFAFVQAAIDDLADIRYNAAHPIKWLGANPVTASEDFIYTGNGTIQPPSEYDEVHFWLVNYTDMAQSIDLLKWYGDGDNPTAITLQPWQVAYVTGVYDDNLGAQWSVEGSEWYEKPAAGIPASDLASAVQTSLGKADTAEQVANKATGINSSNYASTNKYPAMVAMSNLFGKWAKVSQTITWSGSGSGATYALSNITEGLIPQELINQAAVYGVTFNTTTGYFEFGGYTDIAADEMRKAICERRSAFIASMYYTYKGRIVLPFASTSQAGSLAFSGAVHIKEITPILGGYPYLMLANNEFESCWMLQSISNVKIYDGGTTINDSVFKYCENLQSVQIHGIKRNIWLSWSAPLTLASVVYLVDNAANTSSITITLHADAYSRCVADTTEYTYGGQQYTGILAYATARDISIVSA